MNVDSIARDDTVPPGALALTEVISAKAGRVDRVDTEISGIGYRKSLRHRCNSEIEIIRSAPPTGFAVSDHTRASCERLSYVNPPTVSLETISPASLSPP